MQKIRAIGPTVRTLRVARRWTQAELAIHLGLSQSRLSQVERGQGTLSAEQLLRVMQLFHVGAEHFVDVSEDASPVQAALARHGARQLLDDGTLIPSSLTEPLDIVWTVLRAPESARHLAALAPVLVENIDRIAMSELVARATTAARQARLGWLLESVHSVLVETRPVTAKDRRRVRRAQLVLSTLLESGVLKPPAETVPLDLLDPDIRTRQTAEQVFSTASPEARRWRIVTRIRTEDFSQALEAAREAR